MPFEMILSPMTFYLGSFNVCSGCALLGSAVMLAACGERADLAYGLPEGAPCHTVDQCRAPELSACAPAECGGEPVCLSSACGASSTTAVSCGCDRRVRVDCVGPQIAVSKRYFSVFSSAPEEVERGAPCDPELDVPFDLHVSVAGLERYEGLTAKILGETSLNPQALHAEAVVLDGRLEAVLPLGWPGRYALYLDTNGDGKCEPKLDVVTSALEVSVDFLNGRATVRSFDENGDCHPFEG
jgi:hypothetical protein